MIAPVLQSGSPPVDDEAEEYVVAFAARTSALTAPTLSAAVIQAWMSPEFIERWSSRTSMSSRVPSASPLTLREAAQNASWALVKDPDSRIRARAEEQKLPELVLRLRLDGAPGISVWWKDHSDRQVNVFLDPRSPFSCTEAALQAPQAFPDPRQNRPWAACAPSPE